jgi:hypothetical protein
MEVRVDTMLGEAGDQIAGLTGQEVTGCWVGAEVGVQMGQGQNAGEGMGLARGASSVIGRIAAGIQAASPVRVIARMAS